VCMFVSLDRNIDRKRTAKRETRWYY